MPKTAKRLQSGGRVSDADVKARREQKRHTAETKAAFRLRLAKIIQLGGQVSDEDAEAAEKAELPPYKLGEDDEF